MKFPAFEYVRARSVAEAVQFLERYGSDARILAGGQSLLPMLAFRMSSPSLLVDISGIADLRFIEERDGAIRIGALARHVDLERSDIIANRLPLIYRAVPEIAHIAIRNRGTIGGSLSLADPAAQLPACMLALGALMVAMGPAGVRHIPAAEFFMGTYETALDASEVLTHVEIPIPSPKARSHFSQLSRRHGDFAMTGLAAICAREGEEIEELRLVYLGCGDRPLRAARTEALLRRMKSAPDRAELFASLEADLEPSTDLQATAEMRIHLASVLTERAFSDLMSVG